MRCESTFTTDCYRNLKHAIELNRGYSEITASKEHLACYSTRKEKIKRSEMDKEITSRSTHKQLKEIVTIFLRQLT